jgi:hypothetical protein
VAHAASSLFVIRSQISRLAAREKQHEIGSQWNRVHDLPACGSVALKIDKTQ